MERLSYPLCNFMDTFFTDTCMNLISYTFLPFFSFFLPLSLLPPFPPSFSPLLSCFLLVFFLGGSRVEGKQATLSETFQIPSVPFPVLIWREDGVSAHFCSFLPHDSFLNHLIWYHLIIFRAKIAFLFAVGTDYIPPSAYLYNLKFPISENRHWAHLPSQSPSDHLTYACSDPAVGPSKVCFQIISPTSKICFQVFSPHWWPWNSFQNYQ